MSTCRIARFRACIARPRRGARPTAAELSSEVEAFLCSVVERDAAMPRPEAIAALMRLFVEDDLASGVLPDATRACDACGQQRPAAGFVQYDGRMVCNACATAYEVQRACGVARSIGGDCD